MLSQNEKQTIQIAEKNKHDIKRLEVSINEESSNPQKLKSKGFGFGTCLPNKMLSRRLQSLVGLLLAFIFLAEGELLYRCSEKVFLDY